MIMTPGVVNDSECQHKVALKKYAKWLWGIPVLLLIVVLFTPPTPPSFPLPASNGYDDFLKAGALLYAEWPAVRQWIYTPDPKAARTWMSQHSEIFSLVESGLRKQCCVPIQSSTNYMAQHDKDRSRLKLLTHCMIARAELAGTEGRTNNMYDAYVVAYRFAHGIGRGGLDIDWLDQLSYEALVLRSFSPAIPGLSDRQCVDALAFFHQTESDRETIPAVRGRTRDWQRATFESSALAKGRLGVWETLVKEAWHSRSLDPLDKLPARAMARAQGRHQKAVRNVCEQLQRQLGAGRARPENAAEPTTEPLSTTEPGASPNGGPATRFGNAGVSKGPPPVI
jgi:hypothetical protein